MKKTASFLICALYLNVAMAQKTTITVAAFPAVDDIVKASLQVWQKKNPNVEVKVVGREYADHHTAMTTALATSTGLPDVMTLEYGYLGRFAQSGGLEDLDKAPYSVGKHATKMVAYAMAQGRSPNHGQVAIPTDIGPGAMFYRNDLLAKAKVNESELTQSWDSFIQSGQKIKQSTGAYLVAHARDVKDIVIRTGIPEGQGVYFDAQGNSVVDTSPRFKRGFEVAQKIRTQGLDAKINPWSNEWGESLKRGTVSVQMMGAWLGGHLQNWLAPNTSGLWRSTALPERVATSWGGTFYAIPKNAVNKALAWDLIQHLTLNSQQQQMAFEKFNAFPALIEAQNGDFFNQPVAFLGGQKARLDWKATAMQIKPTMVFKNDSVAEEIVNAELDLVLNKNKPIDQALKDAHRLVQRRASR
ncbi:ABC transporter substrate-binding protein [Limnohabitans sp. yimb22184]|uniref:ABC transporter substrate-binding protein n=1 Tax=Limnohabitans sp. YIMB22184 TaxID=3374104 RepID=UPI003A838533